MSSRCIKPWLLHITPMPLITPLLQHFYGEPMVEVGSIIQCSSHTCRWRCVRQVVRGRTKERTTLQPLAFFECRLKCKVANDTYHLAL